MKHERSYTYDAQNRLRSMEDNDGYREEYAYDNGGNRTSVMKFPVPKEKMPGMQGQSGQEAGVRGGSPVENFCINCNSLITPGYKFCGNCGAPVVTAQPESSQPAACPKCGQEIRPGKKFCSKCGTKAG